MDKSKRPFRKSKQSFRRRLPPILPGDRIDYRNTSLISRFISQQGKILSRWVNRLTLKQQRLITIAIKQARILSLLPFLNNEKQFKRTRRTTKAAGRRTRNKISLFFVHLNQNPNPNSNVDWCFVRQIRESRFDYRVVRKKRSEKRFFIFIERV